jgi:hypothetical protein
MSLPWIEIGTVPAAPSLPRQTADDTIVRPEVPTGLSGGVLQQLQNPVILGLLEYRPPLNSVTAQPASRDCGNRAPPGDMAGADTPVEGQSKPSLE